MPLRKQNRRELLRHGAVTGSAGLATGVSDCHPANGTRDPLDNLVVLGNRRQGSYVWLLKNPRVTLPNPLWLMYELRCPWIEGYCCHNSIQAGAALRVIDCDQEPSVALEISENWLSGVDVGCSGADDRNCRLF